MSSRSSDIVGPPGPSLFSPDYTYHYSKISCMKEFYFIHVVTCYLLFFAGIGCLLTRLIPQIKFLHGAFGKSYVLFLLYATASSLLMHNTGLPTAVLYSFAWSLLALSVGWIVIVIYVHRFNEKVMDAVQGNLDHATSTSMRLDSGDHRVGGTKDIRVMISHAKAYLLAKRSVMDRIFSFKTLHGVLLFTSWMSFPGRIFQSDQSGSFTCHTYPVYKPFNSKPFQGAGKNLTLVPETNPNFNRLPWASSEFGFAFRNVAFSLLGCVVVVVAWSVASKRWEKKKMALATTSGTSPLQI